MLECGHCPPYSLLTEKTEFLVFQTLEIPPTPEKEEAMRKSCTYYLLPITYYLTSGVSYEVYFTTDETAFSRNFHLH